MELSLFYFAANADERGAYELLLEGAKFADRNGFAAVWTPERHFHQFGGLYPNPSVTGAAVAAVTRNVDIRAGSVVLPLHDPLRVAEEWSVVDNISGGRAGVAFASGWHAVDFALAPDAYGSRRTAFVDRVDEVRRLWRGEALDRLDGTGNQVQLKTFPRPLQPELPVWITSSGSRATCELAGELKANLLTHLLGQDPEELAEKTAAYRAAGGTHVTLMLHTFIGPDDHSVKEAVRAPMSNYLKNSLDLVTRLAETTEDEEFTLKDLAEEDINFLVTKAFERYYKTSGLFGSVDTALTTLETLKEAGVNEVACLIDFGPDYEETIKSLEYLKVVQSELTH